MVEGVRKREKWEMVGVKMRVKEEKREGGCGDGKGEGLGLEKGEGEDKDGGEEKDG